GAARRQHPRPRYRPVESQRAAGPRTGCHRLCAAARTRHRRIRARAGWRDDCLPRHPAPAPRRAGEAMSRNTLRHRALPALSALSLAVCGSLHAEVPATQNDWGGIGLLQTPTARMAEEGEFAFTVSHTSPYTRYNVTMQPFPWLEGSYRYVNVSGVAYGQESLRGNQNYKDKSIDFKIRLWKEGRWFPQVALGVRDLGGTGLFSTEYAVASKKLGPVDVSLGLATGYLGSHGSLN